MESGNNTGLIKLQKYNKNKINKKFNKLIKQLDNNVLEFPSSQDEIKFLNQIYFLNQKIEDLNDYLDETNQIINELQVEKKISKSFTEEIKIDNKKKELVKNLACLTLLPHIINN